MTHVQKLNRTEFVDLKSFYNFCSLHFSFAFQLKQALPKLRSKVSMRSKVREAYTLIFEVKFFDERFLARDAHVTNANGGLRSGKVEQVPDPLHPKLPQVPRHHVAQVRAKDVGKLLGPRLAAALEVVVRQRAAHVVQLEPRPPRPALLVVREDGLDQGAGRGAGRVGQGQGAHAGPRDVRAGELLPEAVEELEDPLA